MPFIRYNFKKDNKQTYRKANPNIAGPPPANHL